MNDTFRNNYTAEQIDTLLNLYYRDHARPTPYPTIAREMDIGDHAGLDDLVWKIITGYGGKDPRGPRRVYKATGFRVSRVGWVWQARDDAALHAALAGEGQLRMPECDYYYIAAVLGRSVSEVMQRWERLNQDVLGREGFGLK